MFKESIMNPKNWMLTGKDKARFKAKRTFYGENLERALVDIDFSGVNDENGKNLAHLEIDKKFNRVTESEYEKKKATFNSEPYITVVKVHMNPEKPSDGYFELDWNEVFVKQLVESGYIAETQERVVNLWFDEVCANVARENGAVFPNEIEEFKHKSARKVKSEDGKVELM